ncbi:hypothetical protein MNBD_CPR01-56 [hydrothermal vent metagenome]|uniref:Cell division protein FtsL n=1 Tax=hydrothermal vent metagenome TaxID=652676 RepID=A0A3B0UNL1_9ZZZZ
MRRSVNYRKRHVVQQSFGAVFLILVAFWLVSLIWGLSGKAVFAWQVANETEQQASALSARKQSLEKSITELKTARGKEGVMRTAFGVARPGERVIIVMSHKKTHILKKNISWWKRALALVGL